MLLTSQNKKLLPRGVAVLRDETQIIPARDTFYDWYSDFNRSGTVEDLHLTSPIRMLFYFNLSVHIFNITYNSDFAPYILPDNLQIWLAQKER